MSEMGTYIRVRPKSGGPWCYMERCELKETIEGDDPANYDIEEVYMSDADWRALPEFEGW